MSSIQKFYEFWFRPTVKDKDFAAGYIGKNGSEKVVSAVMHRDGTINLQDKPGHEVYNGDDGEEASKIVRRILE